MDDQTLRNQLHHAVENPPFRFAGGSLACTARAGASEKRAKKEKENALLDL